MLYLPCKVKTKKEKDPACTVELVTDEFYFKTFKEANEFRNKVIELLGHPAFRQPRTNVVIRDCNGMKYEFEEKT